LGGLRPPLGLGVVGAASMSERPPSSESWLVSAEALWEERSALHDGLGGFGGELGKV
jgi:hypothetical protein